MLVSLFPTLLMTNRHMPLGSFRSLKIYSMLPDDILHLASNKRVVLAIIALAAVAGVKEKK